MFVAFVILNRFTKNARILSHKNGILNACLHSTLGALDAHLIRINVLQLRPHLMCIVPTESTSRGGFNPDQSGVSRQGRAYVRTMYVILILTLETTKKTHPQSSRNSSLLLKRP